MSPEALTNKHLSSDLTAFIFCLSLFYIYYRCATSIKKQAYFTCCNAQLPPAQCVIHLIVFSLMCTWWFTPGVPKPFHSFQYWEHPVPPLCAHPIFISMGTNTVLETNCSYHSCWWRTFSTFEAYLLQFYTFCLGCK